MSYELTNPSPVTLAQIVDDLQTYHETREMLQASLEKSLEAGARFADSELAPIHDGIAECEAKIEAIGAELADKTDAIAAVLRRMDAEELLIKAEEQRLHGRRKALAASGEWLRGYVLWVMQRNRIDKMKTTCNTLFTRNTEAVVITDSSKVPPQFMTATLKLPGNVWNALIEEYPEVMAFRPSWEPSKTDIKKAIKAGEAVPGADLKFNESLVLR